VVQSRDGGRRWGAGGGGKWRNKDNKDGKVAQAGQGIELE